MLSVILNVDCYIWKYTSITIFSFIFAFIMFRKSSKNDFKVFTCFLFIFIFTQNYATLLFGPEKVKSWDDFNNPRQIYLEFNNPNKCMRTIGFYKYIQMDFFKTYLNFKIFLKRNEKEELKYLKEIYKDMKIHEKNEYTGIFKNKNLIFIQLEGMDDWILNEKNTPTLNSLKENSFIFSEHYSYLISAGATFNSEFCVNTGFYTPISLIDNSYDYFKNTFNSIPKFFKKLNYTLKSFHFNYPEFYNRDLNYLGWGYDKHLSLMKTNQNYDWGYAGLDTELIKNKIFYNEIFKTKGKFLYYMITFGVHCPFKNIRNTHTYYILKKKFGDNIPENLEEDEIAKIQAGETDEMIKLLIEGLKENKLYNNTILIFYADHPLNLDNKSILKKYKNLSDSRINHTPFFIWSANLNKTIIDKVNAQLDILPTVLNLFGITFEENSMIGRDIFDKNNKGIAFFDDFSWIDGEIIVINGKPKKINDSNKFVFDEKYISYWTQVVRDRFKQNDLTLKYNYLKYVLS